MRSARPQGSGAPSPLERLVAAGVEEAPHPGTTKGGEGCGAYGFTRRLIRSGHWGTVWSGANYRGSAFALTVLLTAGGRA